MNDLSMIKRLAEQNFFPGTSGNVSYKTDKVIHITKTSLYKINIKESDFVEMDINGNLLKGENPSTEVKMHLEIYKNAPDAKAIIHAHPPFLTLLSIIEKLPIKETIPETYEALGEIALTSYHKSGSKELAIEVGLKSKNSSCIILNHHGAVTTGNSIKECVVKMEAFEYIAKETYYYMLLKGK
ncbi:MAG: class II aldolase/adducin family protein [Thermoplasmata archaeon]